MLCLCWNRHSISSWALELGRPQEGGSGERVLLLTQGCLPVNEHGGFHHTSHLSLLLKQQLWLLGPSKSSSLPCPPLQGNPSCVCAGERERERESPVSRTQAIKDLETDKRWKQTKDRERGGCRALCAVTHVDKRY